MARIFRPKHTVSVDVTTLDAFAAARGWLDDDDDEHGTKSSVTPKPHIAILKIDVERHEEQVLLGARRLLISKLVRHVFTEVGTEEIHNQKEQAGLQVLIDAGYRLCRIGGYRGPANAVPFDTSDPTTLISLLYTHMANKKKSPYANLWWQADASCPVVA